MAEGQVEALWPKSCGVGLGGSHILIPGGTLDALITHFLETHNKGKGGGKAATGFHQVALQLWGCQLCAPGLPKIPLWAPFSFLIAITTATTTMTSGTF